MGQIKVEKNAGGIEGLCVIEPTVHGDARGYFIETYNQKDMYRIISLLLPKEYSEVCIFRNSFLRENWSVL